MIRHDDRGLVLRGIRDANPVGRARLDDLRLRQRRRARKAVVFPLGLASGTLLAVVAAIALIPGMSRIGTTGSSGQVLRVRPVEVRADERGHVTARFAFDAEGYPWGQTTEVVISANGDRGSAARWRGYEAWEAPPTDHSGEDPWDRARAENYRAPRNPASHPYPGQPTPATEGGPLFAGVRSEQRALATETSRQLGEKPLAPDGVCPEDAGKPAIATMLTDALGARTVLGCHFRPGERVRVELSFAFSGIAPLQAADRRATEAAEDREITARPFLRSRFTLYGDVPEGETIGAVFSPKGPVTTPGLPGPATGRAGTIVCSDAPEFYGRGAWECEGNGKTEDGGGFGTEPATKLYYAYFRLDDGTRWEVFHSGTVARDRDVTIDVWYDFDKGRGGAGSRP